MSCSAEIAFLGQSAYVIMSSRVGCAFWVESGMMGSGAGHPSSLLYHLNLWITYIETNFRNINL